MTEGLTIERQGPVVRVTLARVEKHNALTPGMMDALTNLAGALSADKAARVVVLAAEGRTFCAGGDLDWMRAHAMATPAARETEARRLAGLLAALDALPQIVIAAVQGPAWGGGVGLLSVTDVAVAAEDARFGLTETRLGLIPATIGPYVIARIGPAAFRALAPAARTFGAAEALARGLLARVVPAADLTAAVAGEVAQALAVAPGAAAESKRLVRQIAGGVTPAQVEASIAALAARWQTAEAEAGIAAFFARRPPPWAAGSGD